jgi:predicted ATPase/class 3 adenylate cyclase
MRFGQYESLEILKQRGPVVTIRAKVPGTDRKVILKILQRTALTPERVVAMRREFKLIQSIDSPRVAKAVDLIWEDDCPALVLQDHGGKTLGRHLAEGRPSMADTLRMAISIARALDVVHRAGILHGDINPENIVVGDTPDGAVLIDFGLSHRGGLPPREIAGLRGSPDYVAPEMTGRLMQGADQRADLYSLGVLLYEMLSGELPFASGDLMQKVYSHLAVQPRPLRSLLSTAPDALIDLVARLMAKQPEQRYQTASGLVTDLEYCLGLVEGGPPRDGFVLGTADVPRILSVSATLQGRGPEVATLREAYDKVQNGSPLSMSLGISGGPGVGKTTLVEALRAHVERSGGLFLKCNLDTITADPMSRLLASARNLAEMLLTERYGSLSDWQVRFREGMGDLLAVLASIGPELAALTGENGKATQLGPRENAERLGLVLRQFLRLCASSGLPLVFVVEDVQTADAATLTLLDGLVRTEGPEQLLLILTERAETGHPTRMPDQDRHIRLGELDAEAVAAILSETFRQPPERVLPLAAAILAKVGGAPLAVGQFLGALTDDGHVRLDPRSQFWVWDIEAAQARDAGETVVDLLLSRTEGLTADERATIGAVSLIGRSFTLEDAEAASDLDPDSVSNGLERAIALGWLAPVVGLGTSETDQGLRFTHERVWEAASSLLSAEDRTVVHQRLADMLFKRGAHLASGDALARTAYHLTASLGPSARAEDIAQARGLNAAAGGAALGAGDLRRAHRHFKAATDLLSPDTWRTDLSQSLELTAHAAGAAMLVGAFDEAEAGFETFLSNCPDPVGRAGIHALRVFSNVGQNRSWNAIQVGLASLSELGDPLPEEPSIGHIEAEVGGIFAALAGRRIEDLAALPDATDPTHLAVHQVLAAVSYPSFGSNPLMFATAAARLTARTASVGITEHSVVGFNDFGLVSCGPMNQVEMGYAFSLVAQQLVETRKLVGLRTRVNTIFNAFIKHRKDPIRETLTGLIAARDDGLASGDIHMAALAAFDHAFQVFWIGEQLELADEAFADAAAFCSDLNVGIFPDLIALYRQLIAGLKERPAQPEVLSGSYASGDVLLQTYRENRDPNGLAQLHIAQMLLAHVYGDRNAALAQGRMAAPALDGITSTPAVPAYHALFAMIAVPAADDQQPEPADLEQIRRSAVTTAYWSAQAPHNYRHHDLVVQAQLALASGDEAGWLEGMEAAADHATAQDFTRDAALILERIAEVGRERKRQRRSTHFIRDSWRAWVHYGAEPKVSALSSTHGSDLETFSTSDDAGGDGLSLSLRDQQMDLGALLKATRAISQEVKVQDLLRALIAGVVETAGASSAVVVTPNGNEFRVVAELAAGIDGPAFLAEPDVDGARLCRPDTAPLSVLRLALHLRRTLTTTDVKSDARLAGDAYFADRVPNSLAIIPMINAGRVLGLVCLENREVADAFSGVRMNVLNALCAQAAISWDNALLFDSQSKLLAAADRFVPAELSRLFNRENIADVHPTDAFAARMTIMVSDLRGSSASAERMGPRQTFAMINAFLASFSKAVRDNGGFVLKYVGDGVLALFPEGSADAMNAALDYQKDLEAQTWEDGDGTSLRAGIAIHSGDVMFGVLGNSDRMQIDALSDAVNVAFRLEALTKRFGARVLVSEEALHEVYTTKGASHATRYLGETETIGRKSTVRVHELIDAETEHMRNAKVATLRQFEAGLLAFEQADWVNACVHLSGVLRDNPGDTAASGLFQQAARRMGEMARNNGSGAATDA